MTDLRRKFYDLVEAIAGNVAGNDNRELYMALHAFKEAREADLDQTDLDRVRERSQECSAADGCKHTERDSCWGCEFEVPAGKDETK